MKTASAYGKLCWHIVNHRCNVYTLYVNDSVHWQCKYLLYVNPILKKHVSIMNICAGVFVDNFFFFFVYWLNVWLYPKMEANFLCCNCGPGCANGKSSDCVWMWTYAVLTLYNRLSRSFLFVLCRGSIHKCILCFWSVVENRPVIHL